MPDLWCRDCGTELGPDDVEREVRLYEKCTGLCTPCQEINEEDGVILSRRRIKG